jgi:putative MATE family efflux protein
MISRERIRRILSQGLPVMGGMSTYVFLELVDILFVGMLGTTALAAVGISVFLLYTFLALFGGVTIAVQAATSRLVGEGSLGDESLGDGSPPAVAKFLNAALLIVALVVPLTSALAVVATPVLLVQMTDDPAVIAEGVPYLRWMLAGSAAFALINAFMGFWNATDRAQIYLRVIILEVAVNIPLNYVLMFGAGPIPALGVEGAGIGTFIAAWVGVAYHFWLTYQRARNQGFLAGLPSVEDTRVLIRLMVPAGIQQFLDNLALALMFRIVAWIGTTEVAVYSVLVNLIGAVGVPAFGLGVAGATLVGQAMGRKRPDEAHAWAWDVIKVGVVTMALLGTPFWLFPEVVLSIFIHEPETLQVAVTPCRILGLMITVNGIGYMFASLLNGAGDVRRVMYVNLATQYLVLLPGAYLFAIHLGYGFIGLWLVHQIGFRALNSALFTALWQQKRWADVRLW